MRTKKGGAQESLIPLRAAPSVPLPRTQSGALTGRSERGLPTILLRGEERPREALVLGALRPEEIEAGILRGARCLVCFAEGEPELPYLLGIVQALPEAAPASEERDVAEARLPAPASEATVERDGERLLIEAKKELVLRCGEAEVVLRADGKLRISGVDVISRARRRHRIKGGSVMIN